MFTTAVMVTLTRATLMITYQAAALTGREDARVSVDQIAGSQTAGCVRVIQDNLYPGLTTILTMPHQII